MTTTDNKYPRPKVLNQPKKNRVAHALGYIFGWLIVLILGFLIATAVVSILVLIIVKTWGWMA